MGHFKDPLNLILKQTFYPPDSYHLIFILRTHKATHTNLSIDGEDLLCLFLCLFHLARLKSKLKNISLPQEYCETPDEHRAICLQQRNQLLN